MFVRKKKKSLKKIIRSMNFTYSCFQLTKIPKSYLMHIRNSEWDVGQILGEIQFPVNASGKTSINQWSASKMCPYTQHTPVRLFTMRNCVTKWSLIYIYSLRILEARKQTLYIILYWQTKWQDVISITAAMGNTSLRLL